MAKKIVRIVIGICTAFIALTAIIGGIAILVGVETFPMEWLEGTPFRDYTIPALILIFVVGGSSLLALVTLILKHPLVHITSIIAGIMMIGQIVGELILLNQEQSLPHWIEWMYFALGLVIVGCGVYLWKAQRI
jgi:hypothetical protein